MNRRSATVSAIAMAALLAAGCGGGDSGSKPEKKKSSPGAEAKVVVGGAVAVKPNGKTIVKMKSNGIVMGATRGSKRTGTNVSVGATGGEIVSATAIGFVRTGGGVVFQRGAAQVAFTDLAFSTRKRTVTGTHNGKRMILFQLRVQNIDHETNSKGGLRATGLGVSLTGKSAALINQGLKTNIFSKRTSFGTIVIAVSLRKKSSVAAAKAKADAKAKEQAPAAAKKDSGSKGSEKSPAGSTTTSATTTAKTTK